MRTCQYVIGGIGKFFFQNMYPWYINRGNTGIHRNILGFSFIPILEFIRYTRKYTGICWNFENELAGHSVNVRFDLLVEKHVPLIYSMLLFNKNCTPFNPFFD